MLKLLLLLLITSITGCGSSTSSGQLGNSQSTTSPPSANQPAQPNLGAWKMLASTPEIWDFTASVVVNDDSIYFSQGGGLTGYWCYSIKNNTWRLSAPIPDEKARPYNNLIWLGDDYLYAFDSWGSEGACIWRYSISADKWTKLSIYPSTRPIYSGTDAAGMILNNERYIFVLSSSNDFWRFSLADNTWQKLPVTPYFPSTICAVGDGDIYGIEIGRQVAGFWHYSARDMSYRILKAPPVPFEDYSAEIVTVNNKDLFVMRRAVYDSSTPTWMASKDFLRFSTARNEWTFLESLPISDGVSQPATIASTGNGLYLLLGGNDRRLLNLPISY